MTDRLLRVRGFCSKVGCGRSYLYEKRRTGEFPPPDAYIGCAPVWLESTVDALITRLVETHKAISIETRQSAEDGGP